MKITEYLSLPKTKNIPTCVGQTYCPPSIRKSNPKVGDKIHYMEIKKCSDGEMSEITIELKWSILEENPERQRLNRLLHDLATADFNRIRY